MAKFELATSTLGSAWRAAQPEIAAGNLLSVESISDTFARRVVARAKRRFELTTKPNPPAIGDEAAYINAACQPGSLKGFCFVAADEFAMDLSARGVDAKAVRVVPKKGGGDHFFTVVNKGSSKSSLIVDGTWLQFALGGQRFCLVGTLDKLKGTVKAAAPSIDLLDAYAAGLAAVKKWTAYSCF